MMEVENKLDEDFLFYLGFTNSFIDHLKSKEDEDRCRAWLQKLCGEPCSTVEQKRNRNVYLSNLVLCMQENKLSDPFQKPPHEVDISNAMQVFGHLPADVRPPEWLQDIDEAGDFQDNEDHRDGRTYLATRTLPGGEGAFAYLAVTLAEEEPLWLGGGEGVFEKAMEQKFQEYVPPVTEMEKILLRRKDPEERQKVLDYYSVLLENINTELDGEVVSEQNEDVNWFLQQLVDDLKKKNQYEALTLLAEKQRRVQLLLLLHERVYARREKVAKREEILDDLEQKTITQSFFEDSVEAQDKVELPAAMWEQAINKQPSKKNMDLLFDKYPHVLIEKFLDVLANEKEEIAMRMQKRHENIVTQMRKELRREGEKGKAKAEGAEKSCQQAAPVLAAVKAAFARQLEHEKKLEEVQQSAVSEQAKLYERLRAALYDTQKTVEEQAERGRLLSEQINSVNVQTQLYQQVNDDSIRKTEASNIELMKNIKRMRNAVKMHEQRISQMQSMQKRQPSAAGGQFFVF